MNHLDFSDPAAEQRESDPDADRARLRAAAVDALAVTRRLPWVAGKPPLLLGAAGSDIELWVAAEDAYRRSALLAGGVTLHDLTVVLAAYGVHSSVMRFPDLARPEVLARIVVDRRADVHPADTQRLRALELRGNVSVPHRPLPPVTVLEAETARWGVHLAPLPGACDDQEAETLLLWTRDTGREAWLASGEALAALLVELGLAGYHAVRVDEAATDGALGVALQWEVDGGAVPELLVRVGAPAPGPRPSAP